MRRIALAVRLMDKMHVEKKTRSTIHPRRMRCHSRSVKHRTCAPIWGVFFAAFFIVSCYSSSRSKPWHPKSASSEQVTPELRPPRSPGWSGEGKLPDFSGPLPHHVAVVVERTDLGSRMESVELRRILMRHLTLSSVFSVAPDPFHDPEGMGILSALQSGKIGDVNILIKVAAVHRGRMIDGRATLHFPSHESEKTSGDYATSGSSVREVAKRLAGAIYQSYLGDSGPFNSQIAFIAGTNRNPHSRQLFLIDFDGEGLRRVTFNGDQNILPAWSPRGDLAFTSYSSGNPDLHLLRRGASSTTVISKRNGLNVGAAFSPDGEQIAVTMSLGGNTDIYIIKRDGTMLRRLTDHPKIDVSPGWSPDGTQIVFVSDREGSPQLYLKPSNGQGAARRMTFSGYYNQEPDWCPRRGSSQIVYTARQKGERYELFIIDATTFQSTQITHDYGKNKSPSWSPDCRLIVFSRGKQGLWTITPVGKRRFHLYQSPAESPAWSRH